MARLDKTTGEWIMTAKEKEKAAAKTDLEAKVKELEGQTEMLTAMLGDLALGGGI